jgi:hypothetical protein
MAPFGASSLMENNPNFDGGFGDMAEQLSEQSPTSTSSTLSSDSPLESHAAAMFLRHKVKATRRTRGSPLPARSWRGALFPMPGAVPIAWYKRTVSFFALLLDHDLPVRNVGVHHVLFWWLKHRPFLSTPLRMCLVDCNSPCR